MELSPPKSFSFDFEEALKTGFYTSGTTGCGKSDIGMYCADVLRHNGVTVIVFDPSKDWMTRYPIPYVVNFKVNSSAKPLNGDLSSVKLKDAIFDVSNLTTLQFQELADQFCWLLYKHQAELPPEARSKYFVIFEEAQIVLPEGAMRAKRLQNVVRLATVGRNFGVRIGVITQFAAMVDKSALRYMGQRFFGWTDEWNDVQRISTMVGDEAEKLKYFKSGEFLYYCPSLGIQDKISIEPYSKNK